MFGFQKEGLIKKHIYHISLGKYEFMSIDNLNNYYCKSFDKAEQYSEGLVAVSLHNHWGFIDKNGQEIKIFINKEVK